MQPWVLQLLFFSLLGVFLSGAQPAFQPDQQFTNELASARSRLHSQQPRLATNEVERLATLEARSNRLAQIIPEMLGARSPDFIRVAALLKEFPGTINDLRRYDSPLIFRAINEDKMDVLEFLLAQEADPDPNSPHGETALIRAIENQRIEMAQRLIEAGASVTRTNQQGNSPGAAFLDRWYPSNTQTNNLIPLMLARGLDPFAALRAGETESILERCLQREWGHQGPGFRVTPCMANCS